MEDFLTNQNWESWDDRFFEIYQGEMLICDAHEWINEIPTVPIYYLANLQPRERAWER